MRVFKGLLLVAGGAVAAVSLAGAASAAVIIKPFLGGPFSALNPDRYAPRYSRQKRRQHLRFHVRPGRARGQYQRDAGGGYPER